MCRCFMFLVPILTLLLAGCAPEQTTQIVNVQPVRPWAAAQISAPEISVTPTPIPDNCPVTRPPDPSFVPPAPYSQTAPGDYFWYGTESLWTAVPKNGVWSELPHNLAGYTQKVFWWRKGYSWTDEAEPELSVTGRRLDQPAPPLNVSRATNAFAEDIGSAMLVGVDFPTTGCWEITGRNAGAVLSFVVQVIP